MLTGKRASLAELIGSRICHDLISPIGAISNGVELISMGGDLNGPEIGLIAESAENANARIRFFRIAFGAAPDGQMIGRQEILSILRDVTRGGRTAIEWEPEGDLPRSGVKTAFLVLQCFESAMPRGGHLSVRMLADNWAISGQSDALNFVPELWAMLSDPQSTGPLSPATVQFALAGLSAAEHGRDITLETSPGLIRVRF